MKKHLIAAAVAAAFAVPAMANVTVYGILDLGYHNERTKYSAEGQSASYKRAGLANNGAQSGNRLGFRGEEDLGGGMKASFTYELQTNPDEAAQALSNRQAFIGLSGGFGTLNLGRMLTLHHVNQGAGDLLGNRNNAAGYLGSFDSLVRQSNLIRYTSPSFSGLTVAVEKGFGESIVGPTDPDIAGEVARKQNEQQALRVAFATGPLAVSVALEQVDRYTGFNPDWQTFSGAGTAPGDLAWLSTAYREAGETFPTQTKKESRGLSASYNLGAARIGLVVNDSDYKDLATNAKLDWSATTLNAVVPLGATSLLASVGKGNMKSDGEKIKLDGYQLGADYALSKRTNGYLLASRTKWKLPGLDGNVSVEMMSLGLRHQF
jgi:predicted porin